MQEKKFQRFTSNIDWLLVFSVVVLMVISFFTIYSASINYSLSFRYVLVQLIASSIGLVGFLFFAGFNYQYYKYLGKSLYVLSLMILIAVLVFGSVRRGTKGWFDFDFVSFQPVEITKVMFILVFAAFLDIYAKEARKISFLILAFVLLAGHLILIMMQPDFSSTLSYLPVTLILLFVIGVDSFRLICIIISGGLAIGVPLLWTFVDMQHGVSQGEAFLTKIAFFLKTGWNGFYFICALLFSITFIWWLLWKLKIKVPVVYPIVLSMAILLGCMASIPVEKSLKDYQRKRLIVFLNPNVDPKGSGYNIIQSKIAIGSGKFIGKGFKKGTQTQLGFIPERHTDFIFSVIGEEGGWVISQLTLFFYFIFIWRALVIAKEARDRYGSLVATGIATMFMFYVLVNVGMVMGMMPVTGMPLLMVSYGGSSIFSSLCAVGILCSIQRKRYTYC